MKDKLADEDVDLCPEELPEGLVDYIRTVVLPEDDVLLYKKGGKRGTCWLCGERVVAPEGVKFRSDYCGHCPSCGAEVRYILEGGSRYKADTVDNVATLQPGTDGETLFLRQWRLLRPGTPQELREQPEKYLKETVRYAARGRAAAKWQKEGKSNWNMNIWRYDLKNWERVKNVSEVYDGGYYFYLPSNWRELVADTSLRYIDLEGYVKSRREGHGQDEIRFVLDWARYRAVELLWKAGYRALVRCKVGGGLDRETRNAVRWGAATVREALGLPRRVLKQRTPGKWDIRTLWEENKWWRLVLEGKVKEGELPELRSCKAGLEEIRAALGHATVHKIVRYVGTQIERAEDEYKKKVWDARAAGKAIYCIHWENVGQTWRDYLADCVTLGLDLDDEGVLFPKSLERAHARTIAMVEHQEDERREAAFQRAVKKLEGLAWEEGGLMIRTAASAKELIAEGKALHHCVGGYADRVVKGETAIFFVRDALAPDEPFYTLELKNKQVIQCRTKHNASYERDERVHAFVEAWLRSVVNGKKKQARRAKTAGKTKQKEANAA